MVRRILDALVALVAAATLLVVAWPSLFGLERTLVVSQLVAFRTVGALAGTALAVLALLRAALRRPGRRRGPAGLAVVLLLFCALQGVVIADRGTGGDASATEATGGITVLSWNTLGGAPGAETVARLALAEHASVVALPETRKEIADEVAALMAAAGEPMQSFTVAYDQVSSARSTSLLVSDALGDYTVDAADSGTGQLPSVVAVPAGSGSPTIIAAHPISPTGLDPSSWRDDLDWLAGVCRGDTILAGDLNSTLDHWAHLEHDAGAQLGGCADAALARGAAAVGSWPTAVPALLGTPIDHVLATDQWTATAFHVVESEDDAGSDHRPVVATLVAASAG
ncbi:MAG: endonuclease/exonuclease/phosphatase family protein [Microbacteriaceae bacterium]